MTQGLAISFFVRLHRVTGASLHLDAAREVFRPFGKLGRPERGKPRIGKDAGGNLQPIGHHRSLRGHWC